MLQSGTMHSAVESLQPAAASSSSSSSNQPPLIPDAVPNTSRNRLNPKDFLNSDYVNRLLTASRLTDFYSANIPPHSFFYSEMLRSLVQARNETDRETQAQAAIPYNNPSLPFPLNQRRNRKRAWPHRFSELRSGSAGGVVESNENIPLVNAENDVKMGKIRKKEDKDRDGYPEDKCSPIDQKPKSSLAVMSEKAPGNLIFPPTHTAPWYPPYPPFFIDLRVSGHIYDNEAKPTTSPSLPVTSGLDPKSRQGSAFTVPASSRSSMAPINLTTNQDSMVSSQRMLFKDRYSDDNNNAEEQGFDQQRDEEEIKHRGGYSKLRFEANEEVIAVDDNDA